ncbi:MAG: YbjQ family protein [Chloroflexi bacterium]|nr:YbjQ family protein [Chloroflexota bacterium]
MEQSPRTIKFQLDHRNITTAFGLPGYRIEQSLGVVLGITVRSTSLAGTFKAGLKTVVGGNIGTWTDMCNQARQEAFEQMVQHAAALGANAVIGMRYDANDISSVATEVLAYGTAVVVEPISRS